MHLAAAAGAIDVVKAIVKFDPSTALCINIDGQAPLHLAASRGFKDVTSILLDTPDRGGLLREDSIGQTIYETVGLKVFLKRLRTNTRRSISILSPSHVNVNDRLDKVKTIEEALPRVKEVVKDMIDASKPKDPSTYAFNMNVFIKALESTMEQFKQKLNALPPKPEPKVEDVKNRQDVEDIQATFEVLDKALASNPDARRVLIKLFDVQQSVAANLSRLTDTDAKVDDDSDAEEEPEKQEWRASMVQRTISTSPDSV